MTKADKGDPVVDRRSDQQRWDAHAEQVTMALTEAGHPCHFEKVHFHLGGWQENVIVFDAPRPPLHVLVKAGDLCGIGDLMRRLAEQYGGSFPPSEAS